LISFTDFFFALIINDNNNNNTILTEIILKNNIRIKKKIADKSIEINLVHELKEEKFI